MRTPRCSRTRWHAKGEAATNGDAAPNVHLPSIGDGGWTPAGMRAEAGRDVPVAPPSHGKQQRLGLCAGPSSETATSCGMDKPTQATIDRGIDRLLDFLDVNRQQSVADSGSLDRFFASFGIDKAMFDHINRRIEQDLFPNDAGPGKFSETVKALHGGAVFGLAMGLGIAQETADSQADSM